MAYRCHPHPPWTGGRTWARDPPGRTDLHRGRAVVTDGSETAAPQGRQTALSHELSDLLIQLSIGLHRYGMYPEGHPSLAPTVDNILNRFTDLLQTQNTLSLGVARNQLVIEGVATDPKNPVLHDLAQRLHRHHIGAITFKAGIGHAELHEMLRVVSVDPDRSDNPIGLDPRYTQPIWPHLRIYPLTYDRLRLVDEEPSGDETEQSRSTRTRAAQLWVGLARAALAAGQVQAGEDWAHDGTHDEAHDEADPEVVAQAIESHSRETAYDQVIVGYMLQIADELKAGTTAESATLKRRISGLVSNLDQSTLGDLLEMGGDCTQRRQFLLSASEGMAVDAVVDLVQAASSTHEQTISNSFLRMLQKLAQHAEHDTGRRRIEAETSVREQIASLIRGWSLTDPNPDAYSLALQRMAAANPIFQVAPEQRFLPEPERVIHMALELNVTGDTVERAVDAMIERDRHRWMLDEVQTADSPLAAKAILDRVASLDEIAKLLERENVDADLLDQLLAHAGLSAADVMLDALIASESSHTRRPLISLIVGLGPDVGPHVMRRLENSQWFVRRNMLALLSELPELPETFDAMDYIDDAHGRVRHEALRILLRDDDTRERAICVGLADTDDHNVRLALTAAARDCPAAAVPLLVSRATSGSKRDQRVAAIRVLGATASREALEAFLRIAAPHKTLLGTKPPAKSPEYLSALAELTQFADDPRVRKVLAVAAKSRDGEIARAALGERRSGLFQQQE